jgi:hypothetical protein
LRPLIGDRPPTSGKVAAIAERFSKEAAYMFLMLQRTDAQELASRLDYSGWFSDATSAYTGGG